MLLSLPKRVTVALSPGHITVVGHERGWRRSPGSAQTFACGEPAAGEPAWQTPLAALRAWLAQSKCAPTQVEIIVSDSFVRYALIPWSDQLQNRAELAALSRIHFEALYGTQAAAWEIKLDCGDYGKAGIGCAIDQALMVALRDLCAAHGLRWMSLQPYFMRAFNRWRRRIGRDALFGVVDAGQCVLASLKDGAWHSIRTVRAAQDWEVALPVLIAREILLQGLDAQPPAYLHSLDTVDRTSFGQLANLIMLDGPFVESGKDAGSSMVWSGTI